jgi:tetratricopeptide (TPR) repeat protein
MIPAAFSYDVLMPADAMPRAKSAVLRALELDESLAEAHATLANLQQIYDWNFAASESSFRRALALNPGSAIAYHWYSRLLIQQERPAEAFAAIEHAHELDPLSLPVNIGHAWLHYLARDFDAAIRRCRDVLEIDPAFLPGRIVMVLSLEQKDKFREAQKELEAQPWPKQVLAAIPSFHGVRGRILARAGRRTDAMRDFDKLRQLSRKRFVPALYFAMIHTALGDTDQAFQALEDCFRQRLESILYLGIEPGFRVLHSDPRCADLMRRIGLPQAAPSAS